MANKTTQKPDPKYVQNSEEFWHGFMKFSKIAVVAIIVVLILMAVFLL